MNENNNNELVTIEGFTSPDMTIFDFSNVSARPSITTIVAKTDDEAIALFNGMNSPSQSYSDCVNKPIAVVGFHMDVVDQEDKESGEMLPCPRIVLFGDDGETYQTVSFGMLNGMKKFQQQFGSGLADGSIESVTILPKNIATKGANKMLTFELVSINRPKEAKKK